MLMLDLSDITSWLDSECTFLLGIQNVIYVNIS